MTYAQFYAQVKTLLGNRTDLDDSITVWSQQAVSIAYGKAALNNAQVFTLLEFEESADYSDLYVCGVPPTMAAVSLVSYANTSGDLVPLGTGSVKDLMEVGATPVAYPSKFLRVGPTIYLLPKLTSAPSAVYGLGIGEYITPGAATDSVPLLSYQLPGAVTLAVTFARIHLGEVEQAQALQALNSALLALDLAPKGMEDRVGDVGMKVIL